MYQAIQTKFIGPSNVKGSRVKAWADAGSVTLHWNHAMNIEENHCAAAEALRAKLQWNTENYGALAGGSLPGGGYCFVFVKA